jgi:hypothetical protein
MLPPILLLAICLVPLWVDMWAVRRRDKED